METENGDYEDLEDFEEQVEQLVLENGILLHAVVNLLVKNGAISREDAESARRLRRSRHDHESAPPASNHRA